MTLYEYEGDQLVSSVTVREPEFDEGDVAALIASRRAEAEPRNQYGILVSEATSPDGDPSSWDAKYKFTATRVVDFSVRAAERARKAWEAANEGAESAGNQWAVEKVNLERS